MITLPPEVVDELRRLRETQERERERRRVQKGVCEAKAGCTRRQYPKWHELDFVFCLPTGKPLDVHNVRRDLIALCTRLSLPWQRALHNFRHAHATYLLQRGIPVKVVQERLGHGTAAFTLGTYGHILQRMQAQAAQAMSSMLREASPR